MVKISKILIAGVVSLFATVANSATIFVPTDTNINFILNTGDLTNATIAIFNEAADFDGLGLSLQDGLDLGLEVTVPENISWDGSDLAGLNGSLAIDGDFVIAAICSACTNVWTAGEIDYTSDFTVPESDTYALTFGGVSGFQLVVDLTPVPVPAAVWLFGSGLLGLAGIARRKS